MAAAKALTEPSNQLIEHLVNHTLSITFVYMRYYS
jgi:hypothetical protein